MSNTIGNIFKFTIWGQSHAPAIGVTIEGLPAGTHIDVEKLQSFLDRRRPGQNKYSTPRKESDTVVFEAGLNASSDTVGAPLAAIIRNTNTHSSDYSELVNVPRPGHADYSAMVKYGESRDYAGGGQFSGRLTAAMCIAGGVALQQLESYGIAVHARPVMIGGETDEAKMLEAIEAARADGDSVGGIIECIIENVPAGIGEPMFDGIENRIAQAVFGIPAVKGIEFGNGFGCAALRGSENNDAFTYVGDKIETKSNNHGGILGGITSGMPIVFRAAFKPTPSIAREQDSVNTLTHEDVKLCIKGRHDPCIVLRAVPVVEAAAAAAIYDELLMAKAMGLFDRKEQ
ncbi:MAG: chorismate synthase [Eubacteriales bacterium]|nr:chorismate synthase [Eubacteriales bacterium]